MGNDRRDRSPLSENLTANGGSLDRSTSRHNFPLPFTLFEKGAEGRNRGRDIKIYLVSRCEKTKERKKGREGEKEESYLSQFLLAQYDNEESTSRFG